MPLPVPGFEHDQKNRKIDIHEIKQQDYPDLDTADWMGGYCAGTIEDPGTLLLSDEHRIFM